MSEMKNGMTGAPEAVREGKTALSVRKRKRIITLAILAGILFLAAAGALLWQHEVSEARVWVNGVDITRLSENDCLLALGDGTALYEPKTRTLTLSGARLEAAGEEDAVRTGKDLNVVFEGENTLSGGRYGIFAGGRLSLSGTNSTEIRGEENALRAGGGITVSGRVTLSLWGGEGTTVSGTEEIVLAPLYRVLDENDEDAPLSGKASFIRLRPPVRLSFKPVGGEALDSVEVPWGTAEYELPEPVREGFDFRGWFMTHTYREAFSPDPLTADCTVYAMWEKKADRVLEGIDVDKYQEEIDWQQVAGAGIGFAIVRAGYRGYGESGTLLRDPYFEANMAGAKEVGIPRGVYFYTQAVTVEEALEEAELTLEILDGREFELPVYFDVEYPSDDDGNIGRLYNARLTPREQALLCEAFCNRIREAGYPVMVYANYSILMSGVGEELEKMGLGIWLAQWREHFPSYERDYEFWQYTNNGHVPGINKRVDLVRWYQTLPDEEESEPSQP